MEPRPRSDAALRRDLRRGWEAEGKPPCPLCGTRIAEDEKSCASLVFKAVVHRLCASYPVYASAHQAETCPGYAGCPLGRLRTHPGLWCRCPGTSAVNRIVWARHTGMATVDVPTALSPGCERAAQEAGLGTCYTNTPARESIRDGGLMQDGIVLNKALLGQPSSWHEPPETLAIDVNRSIREGRIVAVRARK
jgi:hypothetical protein